VCFAIEGDSRPGKRSFTGDDDLDLKESERSLTKDSGLPVMDSERSLTRDVGLAVIDSARSLTRDMGLAAMELELSFTGEDDLDFTGSGVGLGWPCSSRNLDILFISSFLGEDGCDATSLVASAGLGDCWFSAARAATCSWTLVGERGRVLIGVKSMG
jgi:hypothetical protein